MKRRYWCVPGDYIDVVYIRFVIVRIVWEVVMILRLLTINLDHRAFSSGIGVVRLIVFVKHVDVFVLAVVFAHLLIGVVDIFITRDCRLGLVALLDSFFLRFQRFVSLTPEKQ